MAVAHVTSSASHASGSFSVSQAAFSWTHTTSTDPQGVLVLVFQGVSATNAVTSVSYDGATVPAVTGGAAHDTATEQGSVTAYFLGSGVPTTNNPTVTVSRTNNTTSMWAVCVTVAAATDTEVVGVVLVEENGAIVEQNVDDGSPGSDSTRYAGVYYGGATPAPAGANSTLLSSNDAGAYGWTAVRETTAGQGARSVGCTQATSDDRAIVALAVREVVASTDWTQTPTDTEGLTDAAVVAGPQKYLTGVSANGRYFVDQDGAPLLVRGDSPWSMFQDLSSANMDTYLGNRAGYGVNVLLCSMIGSVANGSPNDNGATYDGILPFTGGDPTVFNSTYWTRMDTYIAKARDLGITLMIYPMDGWNTTFGGTVFDPGAVTNTQCQTYGQTLATRYASYPNIIWAFGGDYNEDATINARFNACLTGIRAAGNTAPVTIQLDPEKSLSDDSTFWEPKVDWNFVYTYYVTYKGVFDGYNHTWTTSPTTRPALWSEGSYENSFDPHPGTDVVIRRSAGWALTSGSPGEFTGQEGVWNFNADWATRINTTATAQLKVIRDLFESLAWWTLIPDQSSQLVTAGRGTQITTDSVTYVGANTYVTAARAADGSLGVVYLPNAASAITVDMSKIGANPTATWVDPTNGTQVAATVGSTYSRGSNAASGTDWFLVLTGDVTGSLSQQPADTLGMTDTVEVDLKERRRNRVSVAIEIR